MSSFDERTAALWRVESPRLIARLTRLLGDLDAAEELVQDAFVAAIEKWRREGVPGNPAAWLTTTARYLAVDRLRRRDTQRDKYRVVAAAQPQAVEHEPDADLADDLLGLIFMSCHPLLSPDARSALTLKLVCGLSTEDVARAFLVPEATVAQRIVRAKRKMGAAGIPLRIPEGAERVGRLDIVLTVVSVMYSEAHLVPGGDASADRDLADDAVWLARVVVHALPREAEALGLLALILFHRAREGARAVDGELVLLADQDRTSWDRSLIREAQVVLERAAMLRRPGRWQLHAAIAACHADAATADATDWLQVLTLYDMLGAYDRSPIVRLNRAVALAEVDGPAVALTEVDALGDALGGYHLWHAVRARLLESVGRRDEALDEDLRAMQLTQNEAERRLLASRIGPRRESA